SLSTRRFRISYNELLSLVIITNKRKVIMNMKNPKDSQTNKRKVIMNMKNPKDSQNFITSKNHVKNILKNTNITGQDKIIEIGAGKGHFTRELDLISQSVLAIEIDEKLARISQQKIETSNNSKVLTMDFLQFDFPKNTDYKI